MRRIIIVALASAVSACGEVTPTQPERQVANAVENSQLANAQVTQEQLMAMEEPLRLATFYRAISDAGRACQQVESAESAGVHEGHPVWHATCENGAVWTLVIGDDGLVSVVNAAPENVVAAEPSNAQ